MKSQHRAFFVFGIVVIILLLAGFFELENFNARNQSRTFSGFIRSFDSTTGTLFISSQHPETDSLLKRFSLSRGANISTLIYPNSFLTHDISYDNFTKEYTSPDFRITNFSFIFESRGTVITKMSERYIQ